MTAALTTQLRALARSWYLWPLPFVAAYLAWRLSPINVQFHETFINFDPQGDDQVLTAYRQDAFALYTSGFAAGQLLSMLAGLVLVVQHPPTPAHRRLDLAAKARVAAMFSMALALAAAAVALPNAGRRAQDHWGIRELANRGVAVHRLTLSDWSVLVGGHRRRRRLRAVGRDRRGPCRDGGPLAAAGQVPRRLSAPLRRRRRGLRRRPGRSRGGAVAPGGTNPLPPVPLTVLSALGGLLPGTARRHRRRHAALAHTSARGRLVVLPDTGHLVPLERPEAIVAAVRAMTLH